jgi:hypothetical protein
MSDNIDISLNNLKKLIADSQTNQQQLSVGKVLDNLEISGFSLICLILALPFLQPLPLGPFAIFAGATFSALGIQILRGNNTPWLPEKMREVTLSDKMWNRILSLCNWIVNFTSKIAKPSNKNLITGKSGKKIVGGLVFIGGALMSIPMFGIPFNNTFPALVVLFVAIAELQDDGRWVYASIFSLLLTIIYFTAIFFTLLFLGNEAIQIIINKITIFN